MQTQRKARNSDLTFRQLSWWKRIQSEYFGLRGQGTWFQAGEVFQDGRLGLRAIFETLNGGQFTLLTQLIIKKLPDRKFDPDRLFKWRREKDGKEKKAENGSHCWNKFQFMQDLISKYNISTPSQSDNHVKSQGCHSSRICIWDN